jgi:hypothetical protein
MYPFFLVLFYVGSTVSERQEITMKTYIYNTGKLTFTQKWKFSFLPLCSIMLLVPHKLLGTRKSSWEIYIFSFFFVCAEFEEGLL